MATDGNPHQADREVHEKKFKKTRCIAFLRHFVEQRQGGSLPPERLRSEATQKKLGGREIMRRGEEGWKFGGKSSKLILTAV